MAIFNIIVSDIEEKVLLKDMKSIQEWLGNIVHNKIRQCMDEAVLRYTDKRPELLSLAEKESIISKIPEAIQN